MNAEELYYLLEEAWLSGIDRHFCDDFGDTLWLHDMGIGPSVSRIARKSFRHGQYVEYVLFVPIYDEIAHELTEDVYSVWAGQYSDGFHGRVLSEGEAAKIREAFAHLKLANSGADERYGRPLTRAQAHYIFQDLR